MCRCLLSKRVASNYALCAHSQVSRNDGTICQCSTHKTRFNSTMLTLFYVVCTATLLSMNEEKPKQPYLIVQRSICFTTQSVQHSTTKRDRTERDATRQRDRNCWWFSPTVIGVWSWTPNGGPAYRDVYVCCAFVCVCLFVCVLSTVRTCAHDNTKQHSLSRRIHPYKHKNEHTQTPWEHRENPNGTHKKRRSSFRPNHNWFALHVWIVSRKLSAIIHRGNVIRWMTKNTDPHDNFGASWLGNAKLVAASSVFQCHSVCLSSWMVFTFSSIFCVEL